MEDAELFVGAYDRQTIVGKKHRMAVGKLQPAFAAADGHDRDAVAAAEVDLAERPSCDDRFGRDAEFGHVELLERQLPFIQRPFCIGRVVAAEVLAQTLLHFERTAAEPFREDDAGEQRQRHGEAHARSGVEQRRHDGHQNPDAEQAFDENERDERPAVEFAVVPQLSEFGRAVALPEHDEQDRRQHGEDRRQTHRSARPTRNPRLDPRCGVAQEGRFGEDAEDQIECAGQHHAPQQPQPGVVAAFGACARCVTRQRPLPFGGQVPFEIVAGGVGGPHHVGRQEGRDDRYGHDDGIEVVVGHV